MKADVSRGKFIRDLSRRQSTQTDSNKETWKVYSICPKPNLQRLIRPKATMCLLSWKLKNSAIIIFLYQDDKTQFLKCVIEPMMNVIFSMINVPTHEILIMKPTTGTKVLLNTLLLFVWNKRSIRILFLKGLLTNFGYILVTFFVHVNFWNRDLLTL